MPSFENINLITANGNFLTAINAGNMPPAAGNGIATNGPSPPGQNEIFEFLVQNSAGQFALITANGNPVTAANGGGIGNANAEFPNRDPGNTYPLHTDATSARAMEQFSLNINSSTSPWTATIQAPDEHFLTAVNGGGIGDKGANNTPIHTDALPNQIRRDEIWSASEILVYNFIRFEFNTTDDDLSGGTPGRGPSWLSVVFNVADGTAPISLDPINVNNQGQTIPFPPNSGNVCYVALPKPVLTDYLTQMTLRLNQPPNSFPAGTDEWHFNGIRVQLTQNGPPAANVQNPPANPSFDLIRLGSLAEVEVAESSENTVLNKQNPSIVYNIPDIV